MPSVDHQCIDLTLSSGQNNAQVQKVCTTINRILEKSCTRCRQRASAFFKICVCFESFWHFRWIFPLFVVIDRVKVDTCGFENVPIDHLLDEFTFGVRSLVTNLRPPVHPVHLLLLNLFITNIPGLEHRHTNIIGHIGEEVRLSLHTQKVHIASDIDLM